MNEKVIADINRLGKSRIPFLFVIDFEMKKPWVCPLDEVNTQEVLYNFKGFNNASSRPKRDESLIFEVEAVSLERYREAFQMVQQHIGHGDSFLLNLTQPSRVKTNFDLQDIFFQSRAKYKLWFRDEFVVFSPETFIQIKANTISAFPMKGTMDASLPNAKQLLMESEKELAEHYTIVDLIRNDLSMVSKNVCVDEFRYIDHISTHRGELLQMSSKISGQLPPDYNEKLGELLSTLLPAGSISGAPKKKTLEVISAAEKYPRNYYTGIFGYYDGKQMDSAVMIRYLEKGTDGLTYKSGGGITAQSIMEDEYQELIDKIYVPLA